MLLESLVIGGFGNIVDKVNCFAAFGNGVIVSHPYNTEFYNVDNRGKVGICVQNPHSTLHDNGSFATTCALNPIGTIGESHHSIYLNGASPSVTLPDANTCEARIYYIKNLSTGAATVNVVTGGGNIEGGISYTLNHNEGIIVQAFNGNWYIIARYP